MFYSISKPKEIPEAFTDCIGGVLSVVAKEIRIGITPAPGVTIDAMLTKFPVTDGDVSLLESPTTLMKRGEAGTSGFGIRLKIGSSLPSRTSFMNSHYMTLMFSQATTKVAP